MFALILLTDGGYDICDTKRIRNRRKDNTCTVILHHQSRCQARVLACNEKYEMLVEIKKLLDTGSPKVRIRALPNDCAESNNSSILNCSSTSGVLFGDTSRNSTSPVLPILPKKDDRLVPASTNALLTSGNCPDENVSDVQQQLSKTNENNQILFDGNVINVYPSDLLLDGNTSKTTGHVPQNIFSLIDHSYIAIENINLDLGRSENLGSCVELIDGNSFSSTKVRPAESMRVEKGFEDINANVVAVDSKWQCVNNEQRDADRFSEVEQSTGHQDENSNDISETPQCVDDRELLERNILPEVSDIQKLDVQGFNEVVQSVSYRGTNSKDFNEAQQCVADEETLLEDSDNSDIQQRVKNKKNNGTEFSEIPQSIDAQHTHTEIIEHENLYAKDGNETAKGTVSIKLFGESQDTRIYQAIEKVHQSDTYPNAEDVDSQSLYTEEHDINMNISNEKQGEMNTSAGKETLCGNINDTGGTDNISGIDSNSKESEVPISSRLVDGKKKKNISNLAVETHLLQEEELLINDESDDDSDYQPSEQGSSTDGDDEDVTVQKASTKANRLSLSFTENIPGASACDDTKMTVDPSRGPAGDKKENSCVFCYKKQSKISRHLEKVHKDKPDVMKFVCLPKGCILRRKEIAKLRKKGNYIYNTNAELNTGSRIVMRRPNKKYSRAGSDYAHCAKFKGSYSKTSIRIHFLNCTGISSKKNRVVMLSAKQVAGMIHSSASEVVRQKIIPVLRDDDVARVVRYDELLITYTNKQCKKYRSEHFHKMIRQNLRMLGRLLLKLKAINEKVTDFASIYNPEVYDDCVSAVNIVAGLDESTNTYRAPSTASMLGTLIKKVGKKYISDCIKKKENNKLKDVEDFLKLLDEDYIISVNTTVAENQAERSRLKKIKIPSMDDIKKLHDYLARERKKALDSLKNKYTLESWRDLAETSLTSVQLFNRRRVGEVERMKIVDFESYKKVDEKVDKDMWDELSEGARVAARKYVRFEIRGKKCRSVSVLLNSHMLECLEVILENRETAGVISTNPYLFGMPANTTALIHKHLNACVLMRKFSNACDAGDPESLRGTELRKHIATKCLALNLNDQDVGELASFMGHSTDIHKQVYRQTIVSREIMKMSKLLEKVQGGDSESEEEDDSDDDCCDDGKTNDHCVENEDAEHEQHTRSHEDDAAENGPQTSTEPSSKKSPLALKKKRGRPRGKIGVKQDRSRLTEQDRLPPKKRRSSSPRGLVKRVAWTRHEKDTILNEFGTYVSADCKTFPSLKRLDEFISKTPVVQARTSQQLKTWLSNQKKKNRRSSYE